MKKLLLMVGLMLSGSESLSTNTVYAYNGSQFEDIFISCCESKDCPFFEHGYGSGAVLNSGIPFSSQTNQPLSGSTNSNPVYCRVYSTTVNQNTAPTTAPITNTVSVYFDGNGDAAVAFYGEDQDGTNGTNVLRTCFGTDGAMC
jgi:hypothetical protein